MKGVEKVKEVKEVKEVEELPRAGADSLGLVLISVGMAITGLGLRKCALVWSRKNW